ncbi:MAG TPA: RNA polymerase sigma factor [Usitatibacter sp.]|nr:RNA polymerase sigma factor [Usitatibacter sp.]
MKQTALSPGPLDRDIGDVELARRVAGREEPAIRLMMRRHNQALFRTARSILRDDGEAEDAVQEAYMKAIAAIGTFRSDARLGTWLVRITVNEALGRLRRTRRGAEVIRLEGDVPADSDRPMEAADPHPGPESEAMHAQARRIIEGKIDQLPDAFRAVFVLRAVEEMTVEETAAALDITEATVRSRLFRARAMLRESLARSMDRALDDAFGFAGARCDRIVERVVARLAEHPPAGP